MMTDTIGDCFTRIRNAAKANHEAVTIPYSKMKEQIAHLLKTEGFVSDVSVSDEGKNKKSLVIRLKYDSQGRSVLEHIRRKSRPGHRIYHSATKSSKVRGGLGFQILSTSSGIMSDREAMKRKVGGEVVGEVW